MIKEKSSRLLTAIKKNFLWGLAILFGLAVVFVWIWSWRYFFPLIRPDKIEGYGQFGDSFGAINALFSGLAFVGVVFALLLQREDQVGAAKEHKQKMRLQKRALNAHVRAAQANERTALLQEEIGKTQQQLLDAQVRTAQYTHALAEQQRETVRVQTIQARIVALTALLSTREIALQQFQMPITITHPEQMVSYMGRQIPVTQFRGTVSHEINAITAEIAQLRQELIDGGTVPNGGTNAQ